MHAADLLSKRAYLTSDREALVYYGSGEVTRYTYAELNERANRLANWMRQELGVQKGDRVSILAMIHQSVLWPGQDRCDPGTPQLAAGARRTDIHRQ